MVVAVPLLNVPSSKSGDKSAAQRREHREGIEPQRKKGFGFSCSPFQAVGVSADTQRPPKPVPKRPLNEAPLVAAVHSKPLPLGTLSWRIAAGECGLLVAAKRGGGRRGGGRRGGGRRGVGRRGGGRRGGGRRGGGQPVVELLQNQLLGKRKCVFVCRESRGRTTHSIILFIVTLQMDIA
uniref:Uncharacterized protein n=1 Tax=Knipowitschia caucasica TaxID=637954 RepID=A0AAV2JJC1_KNICA